MLALVTNTTSCEKSSQRSSTMMEPSYDHLVQEAEGKITKFVVGLDFGTTYVSSLLLPISHSDKPAPSDTHL